ncbi:DUF3990 domain-containing protein [Faecalicoccus pleomorphus]|uniref:DUF3990 domain-containing protein n=1 Tax=Faecalicoccus pleomorphus TaxID=1323 RepID=A0A7X9NIW4_9FIRM|nr:DUF3990 domain-containing protein [Faecalicoccus pleomorphus]NME45133.1 DUF3990 domain-containing protein [Faecalicoccus pleomorphus]
MNLTEHENRMVYQIESTCQVTILNEISMIGCNTSNYKIKDISDPFVNLRLLSDKEYMALVNDFQKNYRLLGKALIGGVANDKVFNTVELYFDNLIDKKEAIHRLRFEKPNLQYCFRTQKALNLLEFAGSEKV